MPTPYTPRLPCPQATQQHFQPDLLAKASGQTFRPAAHRKAAPQGPRRRFRHEHQRRFPTAQVNASV